MRILPVYLIYAQMHIIDLGRYSNTLLVSLNNRISIREGAPNVVMSSRNPPVFPASTRGSDGSLDMDFTETKRLPAVPNVKSSG